VLVVRLPFLVDNDCEREVYSTALGTLSSRMVLGGHCEIENLDQCRYRKYGGVLVTYHR